jgi:hypothetical protein
MRLIVYGEREEGDAAVQERVETALSIARTVADEMWLGRGRLREGCLVGHAFYGDARQMRRYLPRLLEAGIDRHFQGYNVEVDTCEEAALIDTLPGGGPFGVWLVEDHLDGCVASGYAPTGGRR